MEYGYVDGVWTRYAVSSQYPCDNEPIGGKGTKGTVNMSRNVPQPIMSIVQKEQERTNILLVAVIAVFTILVVFKLK